MENLRQITSRLIPGMSTGDHANTPIFSNKNCLNSTFSRWCMFKPIRRVHSGWWGSTLNNSGSSSVLLSRFPDSVGEWGFRRTLIAIVQQPSSISYPQESLHWAMLGMLLASSPTSCDQPQQLFWPSLGHTLYWSFRIEWSTSAIGDG